MKIKLLIPILFLTFTVVQGQTTFQKTYGGPTGDFGQSVQQTNDGGFIITGITELGAGPSDVYLVKTDSNGVLLWSKTFGGPGNESGYSVQQTNDGGFIITGNTDGFGAGGSWDVYLVKTDSNGVLQWSKTFGGTGSDEGYSVQQTNDGGFIIAGYTTSFGGGDVYLVKTFSDGTLQWTKTYGYSLPSNDMGKSVQQTIDGGFIITGLTSKDESAFDVYLVKTDSVGTLLWAKTFGDTLLDDIGNSVIQTTDGGFIITGTKTHTVTDSLGTYYYGDVYLIKTASDGTMLWTKTYGGTRADEGYSVQQTNDGGFIISGFTQSFGNGVYLMKTALDGTLQWSKTYAPAPAVFANYGYSVQQTSDGGFIISGNTTNVATGFDVYLIKTNINGNSGCYETNPNTIEGSGGTQGTGGMQGTGGVTSTPASQASSGGIETTLCTTTGINEIAEEDYLITIFPNPFSTQTTFHTGNLLKNAALTVYNLYGQQVKQIKNISGQTVTLFRDNLSSGLYFIQLTEDSKVITADKLIITD